MGLVRALVIAILVASATSYADDTATRDLVTEYKRLARDLAMQGNCDAARELVERIRTLDPAFHADEIVPDVVIGFCQDPARAPAVVAPTPNLEVAPPVPLAPLGRTAPSTDRLIPIARPDKPPLDGRIVYEIVLGGVSSLLGILGGGLLGVAICADDSGEFACIGSAVLGAYFGGAMMFGVGVYVAGTDREQAGSLGSAVLGSLVGAGIGIGAAFALASSGSEGLIGAAIIGGPTVGALIGFNRSRRWRHAPNRVGSLFRFDRDGVSLGIPLLVHGEQRGTTTTTLTVLSGAF